MADDERARATRARSAVPVDRAPAKPASKGATRPRAAETSAAASKPLTGRATTTASAVKGRPRAKAAPAAKSAPAKAPVAKATAVATPPAAPLAASKAAPANARAAKRSAGGGTPGALTVAPEPAAAVPADAGPVAPPPPADSPWSAGDAWAADDEDQAEDEVEDDETDDETDDEDDDDEDDDDRPASAVAVEVAPVARSTDGRRTHGSALIAEMLSVRDGERPPAIPAVAVPIARSRRSPRPGGSGKGRLVAVAVVIALVAGAGAGLLVATGIVGAPSKSAYLAKADAVCKATDGPLAAATKPGDYAALSTAAAAFVTAAGAQLGKLRGVERPGGSARSGANAVLRSIDATIQSTHRLQLAAASGGDGVVAAEARDMSAKMTDAGARAKAFGLTVCGSGLAQGTGALSAGSKDLVKAAVVVKANGICRAAEADFNAANAQSSKDPVQAFTRLYAIGQKLLADLRALPVAPGDEAAFASLAALFTKENAMYIQLRDAVLAGNKSRVDQLIKDDSTERALDIQLAAYGLSGCVG